MKILIYNFFITLVFFLAMLSCNSEVKSTKKIEKKIEKWNESGVFNQDSAYKFIAKQVYYGPRVPNTVGHKKCGDWIVKKLSSLGFNVREQIGEVTAFNGAKLPVRNIIGNFNEKAQKKIMLCAHWDTRPFADRDTFNTNQPIVGANDGASGVGVLLEIARIVQKDSLNIGLEIIFFDVEDYGAPNYNFSFSDIQTSNDTWCLGSQYWSYNISKDYKNPEFGILLDMVGAKDAVFPKEEISRKYAGYHLNKLWKLGKHLGYGKYFRKKIAPPLTDDHTYINQIAQIPTMDIIHYDINKSTNRFDFGHFHHTHKDNLEIIDTQTLKAVGQTVLTYLYNI